jgi:hypothetical protein
MRDVEKAMQLASAGTEEELKSLVHHTSHHVVSRILLNSNLTENLAIVIAKRRNISAGILEDLYVDKKWRDSYRIMHALCKNPKTPQKISLSLIKTLRILDIGDITRNQQVPINVRIRAEACLNEKILSLPLGIKMALARRASSNVLMRLIEDGMKEVIPICLDSPCMTECDICKIVSMKKIAAHVIRQIADHPKWPCRYSVQRALVLNNHAPLSRVVNYLKNIRTTDLRELYDLPNIPISTKPFIYRELADRGEDIKPEN